MASISRIIDRSQWLQIYLSILLFFLLEYITKMSSSIPEKGSDVANEKLLEMGCKTSTSTEENSKSSQSNSHVNSSLAGGITIGPPIDQNQINK
ncbi:unnamed protein product [Adineta steineri]|uniref:Uncharacterized protein n=1 Tax=Adineta steineri TaxID=433720 RepID=A0A815DMG5_9BILA|nr:unnamed protein product [Adineta steineri]CAF1299980.1 unnamed protein product [Adineta steineri]